MASSTSGVWNEQAIARSAGKAARKLSPEVIRIRFSLGEDWSGEGAVFFRVLLAEAASQVSGLREVSRRVRETVLDEVQPGRLGLQAYFNFRSESEQAELRDEAWA